MIGPGGAGKSTFAKRLANILDLDVIHLDSLYWNKGWIETPKQDWKKTIERLVTRDSWIMDGNYSGTLDLRLGACDTVIFLDSARMICLWRVTKRALQYRNRTRPDMAPGCPEKLNLKFLLWIWNYQKRTKPRIVRMLKEKAENKNVIWLKTGEEAETFLNGVKNA